ncbi:MAG TPA: zinc ABC transporter substrate-binding protein [Nitrososphaera sp.]|nr:zinc ABC transporter substrate-binding protein [Nitrososphaera sp.]
MKQGRAALAAIAIVIPLAMVATLYTAGTQPQQQQTTASGAAVARERQPLKVVTSFYPLYDFATHVAGDKAEVSSLVPPGIEPHDWEPTLGDVMKARDADVLIINGAGFESWAPGIGAKMLVNTTEGLDLLGSGQEGEGEGVGGQGLHVGVNPHVWLDPVFAKHQVDAIRAALVKADPEDAAYYNDNAERFSSKLDALDSSIRHELASCKKSDFISFHDAFKWFAQRYGLVQHSIQGVSPDGEVLPQKIQEAVTLARSLGLKVIYSEDLIDRRLPDVIASEIPGAKVLVLSPIEGVNSTERAAGIGYMEKMDENVANLKEGLECAA